MDTGKTPSVTSLRDDRPSGATTFGRRPMRVLAATVFGVFAMPTRGGGAAPLLAMRWPINRQPATEVVA